MKFHSIGKQPSRAVSVPPLAGGVNMRDAVNLINDNQLTESLNMWYHDGRLKTRYGMRTREDLNFTLGQMFNNYRFTVKALDVYKTDGEASQRLVMYYTKSTVSNSTYCYFKWVGSEGYIEAPSLIVKYVADNVFVVQSKDSIYAFICGAGNYDIYKLNEADSTWDMLQDLDYTVPTVIIHGLSDDIGNISGTQFEGYNLLGGYAKYVISSVNKNIFIDGSHKMIYGIPYPAGTKLSSFSGKKFTVSHVTTSGDKIEHSVVLNAEGKGSESGYQTGDNLRLVVQGRTFEFHELDGSGIDAVSYVSSDFYVEDNLTITFPAVSSNEEKDKVFRCTQNEWFGGVAEGIAGGTRLFLGGNQKENEKSLMLWSGLNDPLYFPENCYAYVGNNGSAVTGFGKQSDMLVIFKSYETFYTTYQTAEIGAESLINQSVVDYTANTVYFPIIQINASIGCDLPNTIQLCRNRLVWTNKNGHTYSLVTNSQYSERNIYCVSDMVHSGLVKEANLVNAVACDWQGYYLLFCKDRVYLMDYNSYGYQYLYSFSKNEDANIRIPWYIWQFPTEYNSAYVFTISDKLVYFAAQSLLSVAEGNPYAAIFYAEDGYYYDDTPQYTDGVLSIERSVIESKAVTKAFDLSAPNYRKNIATVGLQVSESVETPIKVRLCTDDGDEEYIIEVMGTGSEERSIEHEKSIILNPAMRNIVRFAISFESKGYMSLGGITLVYRLLGGAR